MKSLPEEHKQLIVSILSIAQEPVKMNDIVDSLPDYEESDIRRIVYSLCNSGLMWMRGVTKGAIYATTELGKRMLIEYKE